MPKSFLTRPGDGTKSMPVGLAANTIGVNFQCGNCEYFDEGHCRNMNPALNGREVLSEWCCNLFDRDGMVVIVK